MVRGMDLLSVEGMPRVRLGQTASTPEERHADHMRGHQSSRVLSSLSCPARFVRLHGRGLAPLELVAGGLHGTRARVEAAERAWTELSTSRGSKVWFNSSRACRR